METVLNIQGLGKNYGAIAAVHQLDLQVPKGSVYGLLGPNGSGKTTTLGMILGVIRPSRGHFQWFGEDFHPQRMKRVGAILETPNFYPYLSAYENLQLVATIKNVATDRIETVLKQVNLWERCRDSFKTYSLGMKQRLAIASALLANPEVLILDEPTNGLDPQGISEIRQLIREVAQSGVTIVLASHLLDEVEKVCSHVLVLQKGVKKFEGPVSEINQSQAGIYLASTDNAVLIEALKAMDANGNFSLENDRVLAQFSQSWTPSEVNKKLCEAGIFVNHLESIKKTLEHHFLEITQNP